MRAISNVSEAVSHVDRFEGEPEDFALPIAETMLDPVGVNMAIITDRVLARGWEPNGFEQVPGVRIYRYKRLA